MPQKRLRNEALGEKQKDVLEGVHGAVQGAPGYKRDSACLLLDIDGEIENEEAWEQNLSLLSHIETTCPIPPNNAKGVKPADLVNVKVVRVRNGWTIPIPFATITNSMVFDDMHARWEIASQLLAANENLKIYAFMLNLSFPSDIRLFGEEYLKNYSLDWNRIRAAHIVIHGYPNDVGTYQNLVAGCRKTSATVYQLLTGQIQLDWHPEGHNKFIVIQGTINSQAELGKLTAGCTVIHSRTLHSHEERWTATVLEELQREDYDPKRRKNGAEERKDAPDFPSETPLRQKLDEALSEPIRRPKEKQLYHDFIGDAKTKDGWLDFLLYLQREYPQFCIFHGDLFYYGANSNQFVVPADLLATIQKCDKERRFIVGVLHIKTKVGAHGNAVIIDRRNRSLARFEPHGSETNSYTVANLDKHLLDFVQDRKNKAYGVDVYEPPHEFCPKAGPQAKADVEKYHDFDEKREDRKDRGWCAVLCLMFIHYRLAHPEKPLKEVERMMSDKSGAQMAFETRSYANHVVQSRTRRV